MFNNDNNKELSVKVLEKCVPLICINPIAATKMQIYVEECKDEIGWLGTAVKDNKKNIIYIEDTILFNQEVNSATTEITPEGLANFGEELLKYKGGMEIWNKIKLWGHSHANMNTFASTTDDEQMEIFAENGHNWFIRIICNKKGSMKVDLYFYDMGIIYNNIPWFIGNTKKEEEIITEVSNLYNKLDEIKTNRLKEFRKTIIPEIKEKVKSKTYTSEYWGYGDYFPRNTKKKEKKNKFEIIRSEDDAYKHFDQGDLFELGECETIDEMKETLKMYSTRFFTSKELEYIYEAAKNYIKSIYCHWTK